MRKLWVAAVLAVLAGVATADRLYTPDGGARDVPSESVPAALRQGYREIPTVYYRLRDGGVVDVYEDQIAAVELRGAWRMTDEEVSAYIAKHVDSITRSVDDEQDRSETRSIAIICALVVVGMAVAVLFPRWWRRRLQQ